MLDQLTQTVNIDIQYDRSGRQYTWTDPESGEMFTFPSGPEGKAMAFRFAVSMFAPDVYAAATNIIAQNPHFERRVWKAVNTVLTGGVHILPNLTDTTILATVDSSDQLGGYNIRHDAGYHTCECEDFVTMQAPITNKGIRYCYHLIAYRLHLLTREQAF